MMLQGPEGLKEGGRDEVPREAISEAVCLPGDPLVSRVTKGMGERDISLPFRDTA